MSYYEFKPEDARAFAKDQFIQVKEKGDELHFKKCPYCGQTTNDKYTFSINLKTGQFKCLRNSCGAHGNMVTLAQDFGFSLGSSIDEYYRPQKEFKTFKVPEKIIPKEPAIKYLKSRGISEAVTKRYEITTQTGHDNILVFPFKDQNNETPFIKYRKTDFQKGRDQNKEWCQADGKPVLFGMKQCNLENKTLIITEGQCFDGQAELLTPGGWVRFEDYSGQKVLQIDENMKGSFVNPSRFIVKRHIGKMVNVEIGGNYTSYTTDDHNLVFIDKKGNVLKKKAIEKITTTYKIPTTCSINNEEHRSWTNDMFALYLAISADGTIDYRKNTGPRKAKTPRYVRIALSNERKIQRLRYILDNLNIQYTCNKDSRGYDSICFHCPEWLQSKYLPYWFATETTIEQKRFILSEMVEWDGNRVNGRNQYEYTTILKHNADVMQLIASTCGYMSTIMSKQNGGNEGFTKSYCYKVSVLLGKNHVTTQQFENHKKVVDADQRVYCVTVDTGMILVRQNNCISVSGNCDSLSVAEAGFENAVSVPTGAKGFTWVPYCWDWMQNFDTIIVFGDYEKGHMSLLDEIKQRFSQVIKHVRYEDYKDCKDANEILQKYGREQVKTCVNNAQAEPIKYIRNLSEVAAVNPYDIPKIKTGIKRLDSLLKGGLPLGSITLITGKAGEGKSVLASQLMLEAVDQGHKVFAYSGELTDTAFKAIATLQAGGKHCYKYQSRDGYEGYTLSQENIVLIDNWLNNKVFIYDDSIVGDQDETIVLTKLIEEAIKRCGVDFVIIDNLMTALELEHNGEESKFDKQSTFVKRLARIARTFNIVLVLVAHMRKNNSNRNGNDEVAGSSDITNLASITLMYEKDNQINPDQRLLKVWKNRLFGYINTEGFLMDYDEKSKRIYGQWDDPGADYGWYVPQFEAADPTALPFV